MTGKIILKAYHISPTPGENTPLGTPRCRFYGNINMFLKIEVRGARTGLNLVTIWFTAGLF
jgi:hypothetical protein